MMRYGLSAALLFAAAPVLAQQAAPAAPQSPAQAEVQNAAIAFGQCVQTGAMALAATVTPEAGAATVLGGCINQKQALERAAEKMIASPAVPEDRKAAAREQLRTQLAAVPSQIANGIRQMRAASVTSPPATPAPPQK
jgi:hypothetical protein